EDVTLANCWRSEGPPVLWKIPLGFGYGGAAVSDGRVFVSDYDVNTKEETLRCFSLDDGQEIWRRGHQVKMVNNHGFSRCVPGVSAEMSCRSGPCATSCASMRKPAA